MRRHTSTVRALFAISLLLLCSGILCAADIDGDGVDDSVDLCVDGTPGTGTGPAHQDFDGDGCDDLTEDLDLDNDGVNDPQQLFVCTIILREDGAVNNRVGSEDTNNGQSRNYKVHHAHEPDGTWVNRVYLRTILRDGAETADICTESGLALPSYMPVDSATLDQRTVGADGNLYRLSRVTEAGAWSEDTITWNNQPNVVIPASQELVATKPWTQWDVGADINLFSTGAVANNGWRIHRDDESYTVDTTTVNFTSSEHDPEYRPYLKINYSTGDVNGTDACPLDPLGSLVDSDGDGLCDEGGDLDDDDDGVDDTDDACPLDPADWADFDNDGICDNLDDDDDNDGVGDLTDACPHGVFGNGTGPVNADRDHDGCDDLLEDDDDDGDGIPDDVDTDSDNDGVDNGADSCPEGLLGRGVGTGLGPANADADGDGCDDLAEDLDDDNDLVPDDMVTGSCTLLIDADAFVAQLQPATNFNGEPVLLAGPELSAGAGNAKRIFLAADLNTNCTETGAPLPLGVQLEGAYLRLFTNNRGTDNQLDLARVVDFGAWSEDTITWNNQPAAHPVATDAAIMPGKKKWLIEWNVLADIELFRAGTLNNGWRMVNTDESFNPNTGNSEFSSREYQDHADAALARPRLQIHYRASVPKATLSDQAVLRSNPTLDRFNVSDNKCSFGVDAYQLPWGRTKLLVGTDLASDIPLRDISDSLLFLDHIHGRFADIFGYAFTQDVPAREPEVRLCSEIANAGTANMDIAMSVIYYVGGNTADGQKLQSHFLPTLAHERSHNWQHRRTKFFAQDSGGHDHLYGIEPVLYEQAQQGFMNEVPTAPELQSFGIYHSAMDRYLADPARTWDTYFSAEAIAEYEAGTMAITDVIDRRLIINAMFDWIGWVHGVDGLAAFHSQVEAMRIANGWSINYGEVPDLTPSERNDFFLEALITGLGVDAAAYFDYWKFPVSGSLRTLSETYPSGPGVLDIDSDGFTPLEGDFDEGDGTIYQRAPELADGKDNNLDGQIDEMVITDTPAADLSATPADNVATLPLTIFGEIADLADVDAVQFDLASPSLVTAVLRVDDSDFTVIDTDTGREVFTFVGKMLIDGADTTLGDLNFLLYQTSSRVFGAGAHELVISAAADDTIPANPGEYVLQVFIDDFVSPGMSTEGIADFPFRFSNGSIADPGYSCSNAQDVSTAECQVLVDAFANLGGAGWLDTRGWLASEYPCYWKGVKCDAAGIDRLLLDSDEGRAPVGELAHFDWSALGTSLSVLNLGGLAVGGALPSEFGGFALEEFSFDPASGLCVPTALRTWFDAIPTKSGDLADCCTADPDGDSVATCDDNCALIANPNQLDSDLDSLGDVCDYCAFDPFNDLDGDSICGDIDNCALIANLDQLDSDLDGAGNACDFCPFDALDDGDNDGFCANVDNCPIDTNPGQEDQDLDNIGDACDLCVNDPFNDMDQDGFCANVDNCPGDFNPDQTDDDGDSVGDLCDLCAGNNATGDADLDGICLDWDCDDTDGAGISCMLFRDGFENGDNSAWSSTTP